MTLFPYRKSALGPQLLRLFLPVLLLCAGYASGAQARTYSIATVAWAGWSPLHVAQQEGFWQREGISVTVKNYDDPIVILEAIKTGRIDLAMDMVGSLIGVYMDGTDVVALAETNWSHGGDKIIVKKGRTIEQQRDKPLGVFLNLPSCYYFLGSFLKTRGLALSDFRIVELHPNDLADQFIAGRLPVIVNYDPWATHALKNGGGQVLASSADFAGCIPECIWGYKKYIETMPRQDIKKILRGWIEAACWIHKPGNWERYKQILNEQTFAGHAPYSDKQLRCMVDAVKIHLPAALVRRNRTGGGLSEYIRSLRFFLRENGMLKNKFSVEDIFSNRLIMEVLAERRAAH